jgi:glycosyltransferase involved in cell wall biosynthesis
MLSRRLLFVAYPLLPVSEASAGGAEQILWTLERELVARGWETHVAACEASLVAGQLIATGAAAQLQDSFVERERRHADQVVMASARRQHPLVLDHSGHFFRHARRLDGYVLATLHLPRELYGPGAFEDVPENVYFNCVSQTQMRDFTDLPRMLGVVKNGIDADRFPIGGRRSNYVLWLGRVCPEKAPHLAIEAAKRAGVPIVLAGQVYPFDWHNTYWQRHVKPRIDGKQVRWVELPSFERKSKLLREARALLVTSQVPETTSLVALEAMASGTPVIAFATGALTEVVAKGTGFLVQDILEMAAACASVSEIRSQDCREWVQGEYSAAAMTDGYEILITGLKEQKRLEQRRLHG